MEDTLHTARKNENGELYGNNDIQPDIRNFT